MAYKAINNAYATLAVAMNATDTIAQVATGKGDLFPVITGTDHTYISLENAAGAEEVMKVTARALGSDSMTVVRGQDGTSAKSWLVGDIVECRPCAAVISDLQGEFAAADEAIVASSIAVTPVGGIASTNVQAALAELDTEKQAAGSYAALAGNAAQPFSVGLATAGDHAINKTLADATYQPIGSYQAALGFTPVQQGTGVGQAANTVKLGWSGSRLKATIDASDIGNITTDEFVFGIGGQFLQNVFANRAGGVTYTNSTTQPIFVMVGVNIAAGTSATATINASQVGVIFAQASATWGTFSFMVLPADTYIINGASSIINWVEYRS